MSKLFNVVKRVLAFPFVAALLFVSFNISVLQHLILFARYGGEWLSFEQDDRSSVRELVQYLKAKENV